MRARIIFLLWRAWHHSNNVVHGDGKASIAASAPYLCTYHESFSEPRLETTDCKGKAASFPDREISHVVQNAPSYWSALVEGSFNANVDAGWDHRHSKHAGIWVIIRDHRGAAILCEWKFVPRCASAEEAGLLACLARAWGTLLISKVGLQSSSRIVSTWWKLYMMVAKIAPRDGSATMKFWSYWRSTAEIEVSKVERVSNGLAHALAQLGKSGVSGVLNGEVPTCVSQILANYCNNILV